MVEAPPLVPELRLHLATEVTALWQATETCMNATGLAPPFWAFAWAGGQALARHILDTPALVRDRDVLDFAAGGGLVGLAAARAGARHVTCVEVDPLAVSAIAANAALNGLADRIEARCDDLTTDLSRPAPWSVVLAGDVCYEQPMADRVLAFLRARAAAGATVLMADPGRSFLPRQGMRVAAHLSVPTSLALEDRTRMDTVVYHL
ncbi:class I SAM-dependent methyltransferase [Roseospira marina]|uniref:class I SAM-dependent methyltransferase n=1 Tax=Roseospira marina TaxID=140057 RepID=UPI00183A1BDE|nr:50S ribosomal protein L11 methyltransferase [Roseospira marina]MBB4313856.1 putative nicotinamide N-methyase [Roseospira marina]MBB5087018.1 putative nicotinamide N-methyase [Roseospira marina]